jgi:hypothetical protein
VCEPDATSSTSWSVVQTLHADWRETLPGASTTLTVHESNGQREWRLSTGQATLASPGSSLPPCFVHRITSTPPAQPE